MVTEDAFNSKPNYVDLVKLIRSIQRVEGNLDCYRGGRQQCDQMNCAWRDHCLEQSKGPPKAGGESQEPKKATKPKKDQDNLH
jgi:hypothetical protein